MNRRLFWAIWLLSVLGTVAICTGAFAEETVPPGYTMFCIRSSDCDAVPATVAPFDQAEAVNEAVNADHPPQEYDARYMNRNWHIAAPGEPAWCTVYALTKRAQLPRGATALMWLRPFRGTENHMVLLVNTDRGVVILDNLRRYARPIGALGAYDVLARQEFGSGRWIGP